MENLFRQEVSAHRQNKLDGNISLLQPAPFKYLTLLLVIIAVFTLTFLSFGNYIRKEQVSGFLVPDKGIVKLRSHQNAVISELLVAEGQDVIQGEILIKATSEQFGEKGFEKNQSVIQEYQYQVDLISHQITQVTHQNDLKVSSFEQQLDNLKKELGQITAKKALLTSRIRVNNEITDKLQELSETGYASELEYKRQSDVILQLEQQRLNLETESLSTARNIEVVQNELRTLSIENELTVSQLKNKLHASGLALSRAKQEKSTEFISPVAGQVTAILIEQGSTVENKTSLLSIVPEDSELMAELFVPTSAIGFVEMDQTVNLRFKAFPYERFGVYSGRVIEISNTVILPNEYRKNIALMNPSYRVKVQLDEQFVNAYGNRFNLRPDMQVDADIIIEERTLLRWLFDPIFSLKG